MKIPDYHITDLIQNEDFVQWVIHPCEESNHYWQNWLANHPDRKKDIEISRHIISSVEYANNERLPDHFYSQVLENIVDYSKDERNRNTKQWLDNPRKWWVGIAASLLIVVFATFLFYEKGGLSKGSSPTQNLIVKSTQAGEKLSIRLPDDSWVILNAESRLEFKEDFLTDRYLLLEGEAFFEVQRDEKHPFIIETGELKTEVLGTSFNVRAYPEEINKEIAVVTGKVQITDNDKHFLLMPGKKGSYDTKSRKVRVENYELDEIGWKNGILVFKNTPLKRLFNELERWYGVNFIVVDTDLLKGNYTGSYQNASLEKVLMGISYTIGIEFTMNNKEVIIKKMEEN